MSTNQPAVSVIVATRNRAQLLGRALRAIQRQDLRDFEAIVVDDGSSQATLAEYSELWRGLDDRFRLQLPPVPDLPGTGPSVARNRGIRLARGRYVAFCDDDDYWTKDNHLSTAVEVLDGEDGDLFFANLESRDGDQVEISDWYSMLYPVVRGHRVRTAPEICEVGRAELCTFLTHRHVHLNTVVVRRETLIECGMFWELIRFSEDHHLIMRVVDHSRRNFFCPEIAAVLNITPHERAYSAVDQAERALQTIHASQQVRIVARHPEVARCARKVESWRLLKVAHYLRARGQRQEANRFVLQSLSTSFSWTALKALFGAELPEAD